MSLLSFVQLKNTLLGDSMNEKVTLPRDGKPVQTDGQWAQIASELRAIEMRVEQIVSKRINKSMYAEETLACGHVIQTCEPPSIKRLCRDCKGRQEVVK